MGSNREGGKTADDDDDDEIAVQLWRLDMAQSLEKKDEENILIACFDVFEPCSSSIYLAFLLKDRCCVTESNGCC